MGKYAKAGEWEQKTGHVIALGTSSLEMASGFTGHGAGLLFDATGVGALVGVGLHVVSGLVMMHSYSTFNTAWNRLNMSSTSDEAGSSGSDGSSYGRPNRSVDERTIGETKWSSKEVSEASKSIDNGQTDITVSIKEQAEELFLRKFADRGYKNTTGMNPKEVKADEWRLNNSKEGTYHWDEADHNHPLPHLQIHETAEEGGEIIRISYKM